MAANENKPTKESSDKMMRIIAWQILNDEITNVVAKYPKPAQRWVTYGNKDVFLEFVLDVVEIGKGVHLCPNLVDMLINADEDMKTKLFEVLEGKVNAWKDKEARAAEKKAQEEDPSTAEKEN